MSDLFMEGLHITALGLSVVFIGLSLLIVFLLGINLLSQTKSRQPRPMHGGDVCPEEAGLEGTASDLAKEELVAAIVACLSYMKTDSGRIT
ncbi:MAG TPA: hypothetical protein GX530_08305 [Corynebacteriales bacterium]|jgi:Na+-transporting methylmalonyl-CoA/oxaloacetate decarboxylase gamma subunit|nr:hypothetical protein [Mycobacteriales bacterium]